MYSYLGDATSLVLQHERATAVHIYLTDTDGVVVGIQAGNEITIPEFVDECLAELYDLGA